MNFQHLAYEALNLPHQFRAELAQKLLLSLDEVTKSEKLWFDEALCRSEELDRDDSKVRSADEVFSSIRKIIHQ